MSPIRPRLRWLAVCVLFLAATPAAAVRPDEVLADPALETRARDLSAELRCLVCQNQSIDDSDAPLARDLRLLLRERLVAGDSDAAIRAYLVARYGDFVLLKPPFKTSTFVLWLMPLLLLGFGAIMVAVNLRRRAATAAPAGLSQSEQAKLAELLTRERIDPH
jgi:cytochrome c-type biogenesis protein CcmH